MIAPMRPARFFAAYALDWIAGDPETTPHPVRLIGAAISFGERAFRRPAKPGIEILQGALLTGAIVASAWTAGRAVRKAGAIGDVLLAWTTLATRNLLDESSAVIRRLEVGDLAESRRLLSRIVGRDTEALDEPEIARAVIETLAESLCDGVVAPLIYLAMGGAPAALAYKAVNTLDSMIGHPEPPNRYFGRVAARLDDAANFVPARIAAASLCAAAFLVRGASRQAWSVFMRDGSLHPSPNAGQPEAAMAGALGVRLGGLNYYAGAPSPKPLLGREGRSPNAGDARQALRITGMASLLVFSLAWGCLTIGRRR